MFLQCLSKAGLIVSALIVFLTTQAHGQASPRTVRPRSMSSSASSFTSSTADGFYFSFGGKILMGKMGTEDDATVQSRSLSVLGAETVLGYQISNLIIGVGAEYNLWQQQTKASEVSNTNLGGGQTQIAGVLGYRWVPIALIGKYYFSSDYKMTKSNSTGQKVTYSEPASAFGVQLLYNWSGSSHIGVEYTSLQYEKQKVGSNTNTLGEPAKLNASAVGVVYVWIY